jgi:hypothetical protein
VQPLPRAGDGLEGEARPLAKSEHDHALRGEAFSSRCFSRRATTPRADERPGSFAASGARKLCGHQERPAASGAR